MDDGDGFAPITAMFYSVFHPTEGTKVIHQVPSGAIVPSINDDNKINNSLPDSSSFEQPLFDFDIIKNYVIPKPGLCNKLITLKIENYRVCGFPVNIYAPQYARNSFGFNFCFVFPYESDTTPYEGNIKRIGKMFRALEEQSQLLSKSLKDSTVYFQNSVKVNEDSINEEKEDEKEKGQDLSFSKDNKQYLKIVDDWGDSNRQLLVDKQAPGLNKNWQSKISSIESLIQQIYQDLNNYSECMISIDESNTVDLKLFPISPPPPKVYPYDVPIELVNLNLLIDPLWDPTMLKIIPFINGINSIAQISQLSDVNMDLTKQCIRHLLHYKSISIIDIFQFSNRYLVSSSIREFLSDSKMYRACQEYVFSSKGVFGDIPIKKIKSEVFKDADNNKSEETIVKSLPRSSNTKPELHTVDSSSSSGQFKRNITKIDKIKLPSKVTLFQLYNALNSSESLSQWCIDNEKDLTNIDIRKFITFGLCNGLIARIHVYPVFRNDRSVEDNKDNEMIQMVKDTQHLDSLCTRFQMGRDQILEKLAKFGTVESVER